MEATYWISMTLLFGVNITAIIICRLSYLDLKKKLKHLKELEEVAKGLKQMKQIGGEFVIMKKVNSDNVIFTSE